jgi:hypothetical protein
MIISEIDLVSDACMVPSIIIVSRLSTHKCVLHVQQLPLGILPSEHEELNESEHVSYVIPTCRCVNVRLIDSQVPYLANAAFHTCTQGFNVQFTDNVN